MSDGKEDSSSNHTGLIAGVCTAGGVVILGLLLFLLYKLIGRRNAAKRKDDAVWPDVSHEANYESAPLSTHPTSDAGFVTGNEGRAGVQPPAGERDPCPDPMPAAEESPFHDATAQPVTSMGEAYSTVPDALLPAPASHHAYLQPEAPRANGPPAPEYQHYVVGQTYPQVLDMNKMYYPATRELYHGDQPVSICP